MSFNSRKLELALSTMISKSIGSMLSTIPKRVNGTVVNVPSVILARNMSPVSGQTPPAPDYPFVMVDKAQVQKTVQTQEKQLVEVNGIFEHRHITNITARVNVKVFGTPEHDVSDIAGQLDQSFSVDDYRNLIEQEYGSPLRNSTVSDIVETAATINDVYQEVATFDVYFNTQRTYTVENADSFTDVTITPEIVHT